MITLVPLELKNPDHVAWMYTVRTHPDVAKQLCGPPPAHFDQHVNYLERVLQKGTKQFFLICHGENLCGYCQVTLQPEQLELGWALHPNWWKKGIGKRSIALLIQSVQDTGKALVLIVKKSNTHALYLYQKSGFVIVSETENQEYLMRYEA